MKKKLLNILNNIDSLFVITLIVTAVIVFVKVLIG